jgi:carbonic anhydrase/acetyltransferase-like protein (isoleucine patch superfamily)
VLTPDDHRAGLGFLTVSETTALAARDVRVLDPHSTLVSSHAALAEGVLLYPNVLVQCDAGSRITVGVGTVLYPGTVLIASDGGEIVIGVGCQLGPGGAQVKANQPGARIRLGDGARLFNGCEVVGVSELGVGAQIFGTVSAQSVRLGAGLGGHDWPEPDERGAVLKGSGLARGIELERGQVVNLTRSFADAPVENQSVYHPPARS